MNVYDFSAQRLDGSTESLSAYQGNVLLIVNTASRCGFTPQYQELQILYERYQPRGFEILGFPCNQFASQEPGSDTEIRAFCDQNYHISFPMFAKILVNGPNAHPLYQYLKREAKGALFTEAIKWNFTKFLINRDGNVVKRFAPKTAPHKLAPYIDRLL